MEVLPLIFEQDPFDLVIAAGTAAHYPPEDNRNGSVFIGTKLFLHNDHPNGSNPDIPARIKNCEKTSLI